MAVQIEILLVAVLATPRESNRELSVAVQRRTVSLEKNVPGTSFAGSGFSPSHFQTWQHGALNRRPARTLLHDMRQLVREQTASHFCLWRKFSAVEHDIVSHRV